MTVKASTSLCVVDPGCCCPQYLQFPYRNLLIPLIHVQHTQCSYFCDPLCINQSYIQCPWMDCQTFNTKKHSFGGWPTMYRKAEQLTWGNTELGIISQRNLSGSIQSLHSLNDSESSDRVCRFQQYSRNIITIDTRIGLHAFTFIMQISIKPRHQCDEQTL